MLDIEDLDSESVKIAVEGDLKGGTDNFNNLKDFVENFNSASTIQRVALDLSKITYIDSQSIGLLMMLHQVIQDTGGFAAFIAVSSPAQKIFKLTNLDKVFTFCDDMNAFAQLADGTGTAPVQYAAVDVNNLITELDDVVDSFEDGLKGNSVDTDYILKHPVSSGEIDKLLDQLDSQ